MGLPSDRTDTGEINAPAHGYAMQKIFNRG